MIYSKDQLAIEISACALYASDKLITIDRAYNGILYCSKEVLKEVADKLHRGILDLLYNSSINYIS
jgi:uncharacterized protein (UPF0332 family)